MSRSELAWQSMHLIDVAQTVNGPASDPCYWEADTFTGALIGERPHREAVIAWGLALGIAHYYAGAWLDRAELPEPIKIAARSIDLSYKGFTIGRNHAIGIRPFGDNAAGCPQPVPPRFDPGAQPWR